MTEGSSPAIEIEGVDFGYENRQILIDVNLQIDVKDSICIVGPNGGGKTTLVKLMIGLLAPDRGRITIFGKKVEEGNRLIGYVPQYAEYDKQFPISVKEVVCMGRLGNSFMNRYSKADWEKTMEALREVRLEDYADRSFAALSGGQRQRVLIARALAAGGKIIILDEPTANIDQEAESHLFELLEGLNTRMTILMVTHDVGFASKFFKRIACVNKRVVIHPTSELTGELIKDMYGGDLRMIRHDHTCSEEGHLHE
ncbi:metal ABC transporter ATP-binding protein [Desulfosediminicola ganghwensis]|uniref:metal ABC transporter ATP-binding protein n=1 Tax=Desulfosediminicola ganghwensis TaxID=2569540 RepID=UPI0010ACB3C1|nr:ABC transporter ATP-binding protein [Desulfosediminicola ganghwensis]